MFKILDKYIIKNLLIPFILSLTVLVFLLLTQFLIKHIDKLLNADISILIILEFIFYNSASIISLAIPMSILISSMMSYGKLTSDNEIMAMESSGIHYLRLFVPGIITGTIFVLLMIPFNLWILPDMNKNIKTLSYEISKSKPEIEIKTNNQKNIFFNTIIYINSKIKKNSKLIYEGILINDKKENLTIQAETGSIIPLEDGYIFDLYNGTLHHNMEKSNDYRIIYFNNYKISIPFQDDNLNKGSIVKISDRELNFNELTNKIKKINNDLTNNAKNNENITEKTNLNSKKVDYLTNQLRELEQKNTNNDFNDQISNLRLEIGFSKMEINRLNNNINKLKIERESYIKNKNNYLVEIHKKFALAFACLLFTILGIPLGIISKKGNMSISIGTSLLFFILYWSFLVGGESFADKGQLNPGIAMWSSNIAILIVCILLFNLARIKETINKIKNLKITRR